MVCVYVTTAIGVPVYLHYCGGELEEVSFLTEANGCCDGEEPGEADDCCDNENTFARYSPDFTVKKIVNSDFQIANLNLFTLPNSVTGINIQENYILVQKLFFSPIDLLHSNIIRTTFLRI